MAALKTHHDMEIQLLRQQLIEQWYFTPQLRWHNVRIAVVMGLRWIKFSKMNDVLQRRQAALGLLGRGIRRQPQLMLMPITVNGMRTPGINALQDIQGLRDRLRFHKVHKIHGVLARLIVDAFHDDGMRGARLVNGKGCLDNQSKQCQTRGETLRGKPDVYQPLVLPKIIVYR
ncbi:hypothetical protein MMC22_003877 [Lobaria immixta]|nr:hypothetical protein [Lobaria immixta]